MNKREIHTDRYEIHQEGAWSRDLLEAPLYLFCAMDISVTSSRILYAIHNVHQSTSNISIQHAWAYGNYDN